MLDKLFGFKPPKEKSKVIADIKKIVYGKRQFDEGPPVAELIKKAPIKIPFENISDAWDLRDALLAINGITAWLPRPGTRDPTIHVFYLDNFGAKLTPKELQVIVEKFKAGELGTPATEIPKKDTQVFKRPSKEDHQKCDDTGVCSTDPPISITVSEQMVEKKEIIHRSELKAFQEMISGKGGGVTTLKDIFPSKVEVSYTAPAERHEPLKPEIKNDENDIHEQQEVI